MPRNPYPGFKITNKCNSDTYYETKINFNIIYNNPKLNSLEKPNEQGSLNMDKVQMMINEYKNNPDFLRFKNRVVIGVLNTTWYIVDGQHRVEMAKQLFIENNIDDELIFCWYSCNDENQMRLLFNSINQDSTKNQFYIQQSNFDQLKINEFTKLLKKHYKTFFATKKTMKGHIKTIEELRDDLISIQYFNNDLSIQQLLDDLTTKNNEFYKIVRFLIELDNNPSNFYKDEIKHIEHSIIFSLKHTNFIQWMNTPDIDPIHKHKKGKKRISKKLKDECWIQQFGNLELTCCPISTCSIPIYKNGDKKNWHAGHIISEYNGGDTILSNLKPLCEQCNIDMSDKNWMDYDT